MQKRLYRSRQDQKIAGVCGGIAEYFGIDSTIVRLLWLVSIFAFGTGLLIYIIAALIVPERDHGDSTINLHKDSDGVFKNDGGGHSTNFDEEKNRNILGYSLIIIGAIMFIKRFPLFNWISFKFLFPILLIGCGIVVLGKGFKK